MESSPSGDWYRNPHRLSHCGKVISFNCKRTSDRNELVFRSVSFEREEERFVKAAEGAAVITSSSKRRRSAHVDVVTCEPAADVQERVSLPCVLVTRKSEKAESFRYSLLTLSSSNGLQPCVEFKLPYEMNEGVHLLRGPTVVWTHENQVFYASARAAGVRQLPVRLSHCVVGELPLRGGQVFVLGLQNAEKSESSSDPSTSEALGYFVEGGRAFDGTMILPPPYLRVTRCVSVLSAARVDGLLKVAAVAATSHRQLVHCEDGAVKDVCRLPFERPETIQMVNAGRNGCLFVVSFHRGHVCAVRRETFQIASQWSGVSSVHVDDFLGCGTDQMLLVFEDEGAAGQPLEKFLITDLCGVSYSHGRDAEAPSTSAPPPENHLLTLRALESRLQSGLNVLQELQREVSVKDRVLQQSVRALADVVSDREPVLTPHEQEGLIALWDCDDESRDEASDDKMQDTPAVSSKPHIDKLWHRITEDRMVVGVILTADSSVPMSSVSLSILTETGQSSMPAVIQTQSQMFWLPAPSSSSSPSSSSFPSSSTTSSSTFPEPAAKRSKQHNASRTNDLNTCRLAVTAVTKLTPLLNSGCVKCRVMLHYVQRLDAFAPMSDSTPLVLHCCRIALEINSNIQTQLLKTPQLKTDEAREDFLSLLAVLDRWVFHIDSPDYSLGDIDGWMQKRVGCNKIEVSPRYFLSNSSGPAALMLLHWHQITPFQGELSVHSSQLQMLQFLDSLLAFLPASCSLQPVAGTTGQGVAQMFASALEKEVVSLRECASLLLGDEDEAKKKSIVQEVTPEPDSVEGLQRCREVWQRDMERSRMRLSPLVDVGRYRKLIKSMSKVQLAGDLAALLNTRRTLLR